MTGFCSLCHRVWTLETGQGVCRWCSRNAYCATSTTKPRHAKCSRRRQGTQDNGNGGNGYSHLPEPYLTYYTIAKCFAHKALIDDRSDLLHDIIEGLMRVGERQGQDLTEGAMYRIAEHIKDHYWYRRYSYTNGLDCRHCSREQRAKCRYNWSHGDWSYSDCHRAIRLESLNQPINDSEGNVTELGDLIADDKAVDLAEWIDARTFLIGAPVRLKGIAMKKHKGEALTVAERMYVGRLRRKEQKTLASVTF